MAEQTGPGKQVQPFARPRYTNAHFAEEERVCYELRLAGKSIRQISDLTGIPPSTVYRRLECAINGLLQEPREAVIKMELDRLDRLQQVVVGVMEQQHFVVSEGRVVRPIVGMDEKNKPIFGEPLIDSAPKLAAVDRFLKIQDRRDRYLGLGAPTRVEATITDRSDAHDIELAEMIAEAKAANAVAEQQLREQPE